MLQTTKTHACEECFLIDFVPRERRGETVPCHHVPLNDCGDTVSSLAGPGDDFTVQRAMRGWLRTTIDAMEKAETEGTVHEEKLRSAFLRVLKVSERGAP